LAFTGVFELRIAFCKSAILTTLLPANYTTIVRGVNNTTGIALNEAYKLQ
jgi:hypothetical protein